MPPAGNETAPDRLDEAARLLVAGEIDAAAALYAARLATSPADPQALAGLSRTKTAGDDFTAGRQLARQALAAVDRQGDGAVAPAAPRAAALLALGEAHFRAGDLDAAGLAFRRSLALDPRPAGAWYGLARHALTVPRYQDAGHLLRAAVARDPDDPRIVRRLASLVADREEVLALYRHYLELPPAEGEQVFANSRAWLAVLEEAGDRPLYRLDGPASAAPLRLDQVAGRPWVDVTIGSLPGRPFLLDSGAGGVTLSAALARRLDLHPVSAFTIRGVSAKTRVLPFALLPALQVGPFTFHDVPAVITEDRAAPRGILGLSLLAPLTPALDRFRSLHLARAAPPHPGCPTGTSWRVRNVSGMLRLQARLANRPVHLVIDTGAARSVLSRAGLARLGVSESAGGSATGLDGLTGASGDVGRVRDRVRLAFLGHEVSARGMAVLDLSALSHSLGTEIDGLLGVDLLRGDRLTFDYAAGRLQVRPAAGPPDQRGRRPDGRRSSASRRRPSRTPPGAPRPRRTSSMRRRISSRNRS
ncbi:MAG: aspartyl protease family protein [Acidobacteriota bacterium]